MSDKKPAPKGSKSIADLESQIVGLLGRASVALERGASGVLQGIRAVRLATQAAETAGDPRNLVDVLARGLVAVAKRAGVPEDAVLQKIKQAWERA